MTFWGSDSYAAGRLLFNKEPMADAKGKHLLRVV
jgi:hypothetical protein